MSLAMVAPFLPGHLYLVDGGFSAQLGKYLGQEAVDADPLWTARSLVTSPDSVVRVHRDFLAKGARVILTNSYQVSADGFEKHLGLCAEATLAAVTSSAELAWRAVAEEGRVPGHVLVGGSVGPYGACQHDGSEYSGSYLGAWTRERLAAWHKDRVEGLVRGRVSFVAIETMPHSMEALAVMDCVYQASVLLPAWVTFTLKSPLTLGGGEAVEEAAKAVLGHRLAREGRLAGLGINCSAPGLVSAALRAVRRVTRGTPLVVYPNSGEEWDPVARGWAGEAGAWLALVPEWMALGAVAVGGCCRVGADSLPAIHKEMVKGLCVS